MTTLHLLNVPFEANYKDTVFFANAADQGTYMRSKVVKSFTDFSYQRKDNKIRVPLHIDSLYNCNYVMYQNDYKTGGEYSKTKWFFAFITNMEFVSEERTDVYIETDVIQTWMFDFTVKASFVEREHVTDDTVGANTIPEQLETGEYICDGVHHKTQLYDKMLVVGTTLYLEDYDAMKELIDATNGIIPGGSTYRNVGGSIYNGIYSGVKYYCFGINTTTVKDISQLFGSIAAAGKSDGIVSLFIAPSALIKSGMIDEIDFQMGEVLSSYTADQIPWGAGGDNTPEKPTKLNGYTPRNKKLLTFPYCYLYGSNNSGSANIYHYEYFSGQPDFDIYGAITPSMSIRLIPKNYKGVTKNNDEGLNLGKFPVCAWTTDVYTNWLTQNSLNIGFDVVSGFGQIAAGAVMMGTPVGAVGGALSIMGGAGSIANTLGEIYKHSLIPPAVNGNMNSGDVSCANNLLTFSLYKMNIKKEYARIIDEYFDMFGYKVNRVKVPNKNHRSRYWYTKTIDVNIDGARPNKDLQKIKECYDKGITFWRANTTMGDYDNAANPNNIV